MNTTINNNTTKRNIAPSNRQASMPIPLQEVESRMIVIRQQQVLTDLVMPDLQTSETESTLEINFFIGKLKHTVKRVRKESKEKQQGY